MIDYVAACHFPIVVVSDFFCIIFVIFFIMQNANLVSLPFHYLFAQDKIKFVVDEEIEAKDYIIFLLPIWIYVEFDVINGGHVGELWETEVIEDGLVPCFEYSCVGVPSVVVLFCFKSVFLH